MDWIHLAQHTAPPPCFYGYGQYKFILSAYANRKQNTQIPSVTVLCLSPINNTSLLNSSDGIILICRLEMSG
jgi:hypothetical protein